MDKKVLFRKMRKNRQFMIGVTVFVLILAVCILLPFFLPWDPLGVDLRSKTLPPDYLAKGMEGHIFGTDPVGRDMLTRLLIGGRYSLMIAFSVVIPTVAIGIIAGLCAGYFGGWVDTVIMRVCNIMMALPSLLLAICIVAILGASIKNMIITMTITSWTMTCRMVRGSVLAIRNSEYVQASTVIGAGKLRTMLKEIFPNVLTPVLITASQQFGGVIMNEASMSFLGCGIPIPTPSWGAMIADGRRYLESAPWICVVPGIMLMLTVLSFNFIGNGLRDIFDPKNID